MRPSCALTECDYEGEVAVVIGEADAACKDVPIEAAHKFVAGLTLANDVPARRWQGKKGGGQWNYSKSFDTFCPHLEESQDLTQSTQPGQSQQ